MTWKLALGAEYFKSTALLIYMVKLHPKRVRGYSVCTNRKRWDKISTCATYERGRKDVHPKIQCKKRRANVSKEGLGTLKRHPHVRKNVLFIHTRASDHTIHGHGAVVLVAVTPADVAQHSRPCSCREVLYVCRW